MREAAAMTAGRHDFSCFRALDPTKPGDSPIVVVTAASLEEQADLLSFRLEASHFLWRMVRRLTGTLVKAGLGEITLEQWRGLLNAEPQGLDIAAWTAPASGLFLESVTYPGTSSTKGASAPHRKRIQS
jgi:tRNA pseudouridine38-40 synthase